MDSRDDVARRDAVEGLEETHAVPPLDRPRERVEHPEGVVQGDEGPQRAHPAAAVLPRVVVVVAAARVAGGPHLPITPIAWPSSGRISFSIARVHAAGDPGRQNRRRVLYTPASAPLSIAALPISR